MPSNINEIVRFAVESHQRDRQRVIEKLRLLEDGRVRHESREASGEWRDITHELIADYRSEMALHDQMILAYEKMRE